MQPKRHAPHNLTPNAGKGALLTESDVEQKFLYPFLVHQSYIGLPHEWVRTKEYMSPTEIDKTAGKRYGYVPDYSVWRNGIPLLIVEAKSPDVAVEVGLREARLYAGEINKRYPPDVNPIGHVLASNGEQIALSSWDSEVGALVFDAVDGAPGTTVLDAIISTIGRQALIDRADRLAVHFRAREFSRTYAFMGGQSRRDEQLGVNEFAQALYPVLQNYFANSSESSDEIIDRAYVTSDEIGTYDGVLETYLKDRTKSIAGNQLQTITTTRNSATGISQEIQKFTQNPAFFSRVQLVVGAVGSGKSTFLRRFYRRLLAKDVGERTRWAFLDFNFIPPDDLNSSIAERFALSFAEINGVDIHDLDVLERIFNVEIKQFERGPSRLLREIDPAEFARRKASMIEDGAKTPIKLAAALSRHYSGEKGLGIVTVFDNVDKRSRDDQLKIFEGAQWFKDMTKSLVLVNLRNSTFEAHREEPPLDAFINALNFYIKPPRFAQVIRKRLELALEKLAEEVTEAQYYSTESGLRIRYPASRLGEFMLSIYLSLFERKNAQVAASLEALVAKDVRRALGMFSDIIVSPHVPTSQITGVAMSSGATRIDENRIIRALMRGRYRYYTGKSIYVRNIISADLDHRRPSNFLKVDILEYLSRNRKERIDFNQEGYALTSTVVAKMGQLGYDDEDTLSAVRTLVNWGLIEPESLILEAVNMDDPVRLHASGFIHMRFFLNRAEYLIGVTTDMAFASRSVAEDIGNAWSSQEHQNELAFGARRKILLRVSDYFSFEYTRRCRRHAFYEEAGFGGRAVVSALKKQVEDLALR